MMDTPVPFEHGHKVIAFILIVSSMLFIDKIAGIVLPDFAYIAAIAILFLISDYSTIIYMLCFLFPLTFLFSSLAYLWLAILAIMTGKNILKSDHTQKNRSIQFLRFILIAFFILWEYNTHRLYGISDTNRMGGYMLTIALFFYLLYEKNDDFQYKYCIKLYIDGVFVLFILFLINSFAHAPSNWLVLLSSGMLRFGSTASSEFEDMTVNLNANTLAYYSITGIACCMTLIRERLKQDSLKRSWFFAQFSFMIIVGMLTVSRSWLFCVFIVFFLYFLTLKNPGKHILVYCLVTFSTVTVVYLFSQKIGIFNAFLSRFAEDDFDTGAGRTDIFRDYWQAFFSSWNYIIYGTGTTDYAHVIGLFRSMHNGLQQVIICLGIPCSIIFFTSIIIPVFNEKKGNKIALIYWLPLVSVFFFTQSIQFLNPPLLVYPYILGLYALRIPKQTEPGKTSET